MARRGRKPFELPKQLIERYRKGKLTVAEVAKVAGCSMSVAIKHLRAADCTIRQRQAEIPPDIVQRYASGEWDLDAVARAVDISSYTARAALRRAGVTVRSRKG
jgi:hypothetical protein